MIIVLAIFILCWSTVISRSQLHAAKSKKIAIQTNNSACWYELKYNHLSLPMKYISYEVHIH